MFFIMFFAETTRVCISVADAFLQLEHSARALNVSGCCVDRCVDVNMGSKST